MFPDAHEMKLMSFAVASQERTLLDDQRYNGVQINGDSFLTLCDPAS